MSIETMTLDEVEATLAQLRERRKTLKQGGKAAERKIGVLARRRERLMAKVQDLNDQILALQSEAATTADTMPRRRGRRPKNLG